MESVCALVFPLPNWFLLFSYRGIIHRIWRRVSKLKHYPVALYECEVYDNLMAYKTSTRKIIQVLSEAAKRGKRR